MSTTNTLYPVEIATQIHPAPEQNLTLSDLLGILPTQLGMPNPAMQYTRLMGHLNQAREFTHVPIVGVCGTVNSGKSTIVAGFLSDAGSARVLVGELDSEGTHRFVFWLPASWRTNGLSEIVEKMVETATGTSPELLSEDPAEAARQYNAVRNRTIEFNIPLIAFDSKLDEAGIAFLDCPDTQRPLDDEAEDFTANLRLQCLRTIAPMCSAFVVVASMQQKGTEEIGKVFKTITDPAIGAPLYFVLNMTKTSEIGIYRAEAESTLKKWGMTGKVRRIYLSPTIRPENSDARVRPVVTSMDEDRARLDALPRELDPAELQQKHRLSCANHLKGFLGIVAGNVDEQFNKGMQLTTEASDRVCSFLSQKLIDQNGHPRALEFTQAARQMAESIQRTAPIGIRIAQTPGRWLRELTAKWKSRDATEHEMQHAAQISTSEFSQFMLGSRFLSPQVTKEQLDVVWKNAFDQVIAKGKEQGIAPDELDAMTNRMWNEVPFGTKIALFKNVVVAASAIAVVGLLLPFDGGASLVLLTKAHLVLGGPEILAMLVGGSLVGTIMSGKEAEKLVHKFESECARPQINMLYDGLVDGLGMPRRPGKDPQLQSNGKPCHECQASGLEALPEVIKTLTHPLIELNREEWDKMIKLTIPEAP